MENPNDGLGLVLAITAASGLGLAVAVSRLAYEGGTNGLTVAMTRGVLLVIGLFCFCRLTGRKLRMPLRDHMHCLGLGVLMALMFYGNVGSVEFISVGLAALLFYTFPPIVAAIQLIIIREPVPLAKIAAIAMAFVGLAIMLGASLSNSNPLGVTLALGAAVAAAWNSVWMMRKLKHRDPLVLTFNMAIIAALLLCLITIGSDQVQAPDRPVGWLGLVLVVVLQASSIPLYFLAIARIGALKSAMVSNVQPVVSIITAYVLYRELLSPPQFVGGAMVLGAVWLMQRIDHKRRQR